MKEEQGGQLRYLHALFGNKSGVTIVEALIVGFITIIILAALLSVLTTGQVSSSLNTATLESEAYASAIMDSINRDLREAVIQWLVNTTPEPSSNYIKIELWDWNTTTNERVKTGAFVEYIYVPASQTFTRRLTNASGDVVNEVVFTKGQKRPYVSASPFYTSHVDFGDSTTDFQITELQGNRNLYVVITVQEPTRGVAGGKEIFFTLKSEVRIRNE